jgi:hypothetical protein
LFIKYTSSAVSAFFSYFGFEAEQFQQYLHYPAHQNSQLQQQAGKLIRKNSGFAEPGGEFGAPNCSLGE